MIAAFSVRNVYGNPLIYPNGERARALCDLAGKKTLTARELVLIRDRLGIEVVVEGSSVDAELIFAAMAAASVPA